jgi:hypothetical protein
MLASTNVGGTPFSSAIAFAAAMRFGPMSTPMTAAPCFANHTD